MTARLELAISGMTCASCAARVERKLNRLEGVAATVNYATERASVSFEADAPTTAQDVVAAVEQAGYEAVLPSATTDAHVQHDPVDALRRRLVFSAIATVPLLALGMVPALQFDNWQWISLQLATPILVWAALPFHRATWLNLRHGTATMDTLISIGTIAAWTWSVVSLLFLGAGDPGMRHALSFVPERGGPAGDVYFEAVGVVVTFLLAGRWFEARAKRSAGAALRALLELGAKEVSILDADGVEHRIPIEQLKVDHRFIVRPGEKVATDGIVYKGVSAIDRSLLTGESVPVEVHPGEPVTGATVNAGGGLLIVRATRVGADTALAQIGRLVTDAQTGKAPVQRLADRVAAIFVPIVLAIAAATLGFWIGAGDTGLAFAAAVAVVIIACPCALGLATPTALLVGTGRGAQLGVLIRGPEILESTRRVDTIVIDKTGTATSGRMSLRSITVADGVSEAQALWLVGNLQNGSEHPIGRAIAAAAQALDAAPAAVEDFASRPGLGVQGTVAGRAIIAGRPALLESADPSLALPPALERARAAAEADGLTAIAASWDGAARALFVVADTVKPTSREAVRRLKELGLHTILLTGDNAPTARAVAARIGVDDVVAEVLPAEKADVVRRLQSGPPARVVAMVGDGVNDAPALAQADLGMAIGTGSDVAIEASDVTLVSGDLRLAADALRLSRRTLRTIKSNLFWAFAYNVAALPLAAAGLLNPMIAGAAMAASSVFVVANSLRLRGFRTERDGADAAAARSALRAPQPDRPADGDLGHGRGDPRGLPRRELLLELGHVDAVGVESDAQREVVLHPQEVEVAADVGGVRRLHWHPFLPGGAQGQTGHESPQIGILRWVSRRRPSSCGLSVAVIVASVLVLCSCGDAEQPGSASARAGAAAIEPLPTRNPHAKAVEPVAGESAAYANLPTADPTDAPPAAGASAALPKLKKSSGPTSDAAISNADVLKNGIALPPIEAPEEVRLIVEAGNQIARTPYLWGGGHGKWLDHGYDCSGSVSFALANAGLLGGPQTSGALMGWGKPGKGKWITIYANAGHVFMVVAGVRFDTSGNRKTGSRWQKDMRGTGGFVARHPPGL